MAGYGLLISLLSSYYTVAVVLVVVGIVLLTQPQIEPVISWILKTKLSVFEKGSRTGIETRFNHA